MVCNLGLMVHMLLLRMSHRNVAFIGAFLYSLGAFGSVFMQDFAQAIICVGIIQGESINII